MNENLPKIGDIGRALQLALLGMIKSNLRAVFFRLNQQGKTLVIDMLYEGEVGDDENEISSEIETQVISHFYSMLSISVQSLTWKKSFKPEYDGAHCVFERRETSHTL